jgi:hypothetical protein
MSLSSYLPLILPILLLLGMIPLVLGLMRANELFALRARDGVVTVLRGRIPPRLLSDIRDIMKRPPLVPAKIRIVVEDSAPRVYVEGELSDAQKQRLRNVVSTWPVAKIRNAPRA